MFPALPTLVFSALFAVILVAPGATRAQQQPASPGLVRVETIVTVLGNKSSPPPAIQKDDVTVYEGQVRKDVLYWLPARGDRASLQLAIVIDDADSNRIGNQFNQLRKFILVQPETTSIGIYYANSGVIRTASQLNPDHQAVAKALRLPLGTFGNLASVYDSLQRLMAGWPLTGARREILLISEGFDPWSRGLDCPPDVDAATNMAQHYGILIHPIFVNAVGRFAPFDISGRGYLYEVAHETGGRPLLQGTWTPASFEPLLSELETALQNQYFLVWATNPSKVKTGQLRPFKIRLEENDVRVVAPGKVFVPALP
jgi:hypothetical protein